MGSATDKQQEIITNYVDSAKSFVQWSGAALVFPAALRSIVYGASAEKGGFTSVELVASCALWVCFLVAIGAGVLYHYAAIKTIELKWWPDAYVPPPLEDTVRKRGPRVFYGVMLVAFFLGAVCLVAVSAVMFMK